MPWNTLNKAYNHKDVLQRPLESANGKSPPKKKIAAALLPAQQNGGPVHAEPNPHCHSVGPNHFFARMRRKILRISEATSTKNARPMHSSHAIGGSGVVPNAVLRNGT